MRAGGHRRDTKINYAHIQTIRNGRVKFCDDCLNGLRVVLRTRMACAAPAAGAAAAAGASGGDRGETIVSMKRVSVDTNI